MEKLEKLCNRLDVINRTVGRGIAWVSLIMVVVVTVDVIMRYLFKTTFVFVQELEWHLFGVLFLVGAGYTLLYDAHVRVDVFYNDFHRKPKPGSISWAACFSCFRAVTSSSPHP